MKRTHASRFRSSVVVLVLLLVTNAAIVIAQTATVATVAPADVADSGAETSTEAPPATVVPAGGSGDDTSSNSGPSSDTSSSSSRTDHSSCDHISSYYGTGAGHLDANSYYSSSSIYHSNSNDSYSRYDNLSTPCNSSTCCVIIFQCFGFRDRIVGLSSGDSGANPSPGGGVGNAGGLTLSPITSDESDTDTGTDADADTSHNNNSDSDPSNASTSSGQSESLGGWKLALVIVGAVCAVLASVFFVHMRHVRVAAANKRDRGSTQQRALDSFFRQNRVTVARETGISSGNFVTDPLTPRDEIAVTMPSNAHDRPRTKTADLIAGSAAQAFNRRTRPDSSASIDTPTDSHNDEYDSFTGRHNAPSVVSTGSSNLYRSDSSNIYRSDSVFSDTSSVSLGSIAPSSQRSVQTPLFPTRLDTVASSTARNSKRASSATSIGDVRDTNRSDRSSSDFSVFNSPSVASSDGDIYRISTQLIDVSALPATTSEKSEPNNSYPSNGRMSEALSEFSVDESYTSELTGTESFSTEFSVDDGFRTDDSFATVDSFATRTTQDTEDDRDSDSLVLRNSKESELSEGEI
ncbi:hypothetical protein JG687_00011446 [Phytophthora cactorum]|uniref:Membrane-associated protein n=1 Tax=Phytophthora cactorum TaxID=29920 RepID=A0A8T1U728_9STRA|nr:hypothetical protein JG687_00011446 [Phytophthora cactorum]